jgi:hypothetical protein
LTVRGPAAAAKELTLVTTDLVSTAAALVARYAGRWSIEVAVLDGQRFVGAGQARDRTRAAVERTVPFAMVRAGLIPLWYSQFGDPTADVADRRRTAPWYTTKKDPSFEDMLAALRRAVITARFTPPRAQAPTPAEIPRVQQAWELPINNSLIPSAIPASYGPNDPTEPGSYFSAAPWAAAAA